VTGDEETSALVCDDTKVAADLANINYHRNLHLF